MRGINLAEETVTRRPPLTDEQMRFLRRFKTSLTELAQAVADERDSKVDQDQPGTPVPALGSAGDSDGDQEAPQAGAVRDSDRHIDALIRGLREATKLYTDNADTDDHGRAGALLALQTVRKFLMMLEIDRMGIDGPGGFAAPIAGLLTALGDVERGINNPMFKLTSASRTAPASWYLVRALAAYASDALIEIGEKATEADTEIAQELTNLGVIKKRWGYGDKKEEDDAGGIRARTIQGWRTEISKDVDRERFETQLFYMLKELPARFRTREQVLKRLEIMVKRLRPTSEPVGSRD